MNPITYIYYRLFPDTTCGHDLLDPQTGKPVGGRKHRASDGVCPECCNEDGGSDNDTSDDVPAPDPELALV